jgi:uroporphyrinogen-III decarboxylase
MNNIAIASTGTVRQSHVAALPDNGASMLRAELELMLDEDIYLKKVAGAAALLVARLDRMTLSGGTAMAAFTLARLIEGMPKDMMSEAMSLLRSS